MMSAEKSLPGALENCEQVTAAFFRLIESASHNLAILSCRLNPALFNDQSIIESLRQRVLDRRRLSVRILIREPRLAVSNAPRFLALARQLSSNFQLRAPAQDTGKQIASLIIADRSSMIHRSSPERWIGLFVTGEPVRIKDSLQAFDHAWDESVPSVELREIRV
jgi:hypothetical protein